MSLVWRCRDYPQRLRLDDSVIAHLSKHRQINALTSEAGGQLFGTVTAIEVRVMSATGPYSNDERGRYRYRSDAGSAQRAITAQTKGGLIYLGEWHSHAEDFPTPSGDDIGAMTTLRSKSRLSTSSILLVIIGRAELPAGICVCSFGEYGQIDWQCGEDSFMHENFVSKVKKTIRTAIARISSWNSA